MKEKNVFGGIPKFWRWFCEDQGHENFVLDSFSFKAYMTLQVTQGNIYLTWYEDGH